MKFNSTRFLALSPHTVTETHIPNAQLFSRGFPPVSSRSAVWQWAIWLLLSHGMDHTIQKREIE